MHMWWQRMGFWNIEIQFTYHNIHPFKVYFSMVFNIVTESCSLHDYVVSEQFHHSKTL